MMTRLPDFKRRQRWGEQHADELNELVTVAERADKIMEGPGIRIRRTPIGKIIENAWRPTDVAALIESAGAVTRFLLVAPAFLRADYLLCANEFDEQGQPTSIVFVAKQWEVRKTPFHGETIIFEDGLRISYDYDDPSSSTKRVATRTGIPGREPSIVTEKQIVIPRYIISGQIYAAKPVGGTAAFVNPDADPPTGPIEWQDVGNQRAFTRRHSQLN